MHLVLRLFKSVVQENVYKILSTTKCFKAAPICLRSVVTISCGQEMLAVPFFVQMREESRHRQKFKYIFNLFARDLQYVSKISDQKLKIVHGDILKFDLQQAFPKDQGRAWNEGKD